MWGTKKQRVHPSASIYWACIIFQVFYTLRTEVNKIDSIPFPEELVFRELEAAYHISCRGYIWDREANCIERWPETLRGVDNLRDTDMEGWLCLKAKWHDPDIYTDIKCLLRTRSPTCAFLPSILHTPDSGILIRDGGWEHWVNWENSDRPEISLHWQDWSLFIYLAIDRMETRDRNWI